MAKTIILYATFVFFSFTNYAQVPTAYSEWTKKAMAFYEAKKYPESADAFSRAFAANDGKGFANDRYNAACSWALTGNNDSSFFQLERIATTSNYTNYNHLITDTDLDNLHKDTRWKEICELVKKNKDKAEANLNKPLVAILDTIRQNDQGGRMQMDNVAKKYGRDSKEMRELWQKQKYHDSVDLIKVEAILDKYGWLGADVVGREGNQTLFLVIQHSDIKVQQKYLPMMREAVRNQKAQASSLALLEDRVALREGRKQVYGSQIHMEPDGTSWVSPLEDPDNVDKRRQEVGLGPLSEYVQHWNIKWDVAEYKKQLPEIEKKEKR